MESTRDVSACNAQETIFATHVRQSLWLLRKEIFCLWACSQASAPDNFVSNEFSIFFHVLQCIMSYYLLAVHNLLVASVTHRNTYFLSFRAERKKTWREDYKLFCWWGSLNLLHTTLLLFNAYCSNKEGGREDVCSTRQLKMTLAPENIYQLLLFKVTERAEAIKWIKDGY